MSLKTTPFDPALFLTDNAAVASYLNDMMEEGDPGMLAAALGDIARARGMAEVAAAAGIGRESLYKALRTDAQPRFDTIQRVCTALGLKLVALPLEPAATTEEDQHADETHS